MLASNGELNPLELLHCSLSLFLLSLSLGMHLVRAVAWQTRAKKLSSNPPLEHSCWRLKKKRQTEVPGPWLRARKDLPPPTNYGAAVGEGRDASFRASICAANLHLAR